MRRTFLLIGLPLGLAISCGEEVTVPGADATPPTATVTIAQVDPDGNIVATHSIDQDDATIRHSAVASDLIVVGVGADDEGVKSLELSCQIVVACMMYGELTLDGVPDLIPLPVVDDEVSIYASAASPGDTAFDARYVSQTWSLDDAGDACPETAVAGGVFLEFASVGMRGLRCAASSENFHGGSATTTWLRVGSF